MIYSLDEITLIPSVTSNVNSRSEVHPFDENGKLPLFVAPMTCLVDKSNFPIFNQKTYAIMPVFHDKERITEPFTVERQWFACTLNQIAEICDVTEHSDAEYWVCIDVANGHMSKLYTYAKKFKHKFPKSLLMVGNIANAETYLKCSEANIDYVRVGIGGGSGCVTSVNTGFHGNHTMLLNQINDLRWRIGLGTRTKVVADGGIDNFARAIKCLALGADYVMMGKAFACCEESLCEKVYVHKTIDAFNREKFDVKSLAEYHMERKELDKLGYTYAGKYYGQASYQGQIDRFGYYKNVEEGVSLYVPMNNTYTHFTEQFEGYLRSAMSYAGVFTLDEFCGNVRYEIQSIAEFNAYNK
jgi:IMP dehydrogenase/GMP reductase